MSSPVFDEKGSAYTTMPRTRDNPWRSLLIGSIPLVSLSGISIITLTLVTLTRQQLAPEGFLVQQQVDLIVLITGLVLALAAFVISAWLILRRVAVWQQEGLEQRVRLVLWTLAGTALIITLPVLFGALLPQHPSP